MSTVFDTAGIPPSVRCFILDGDDTVTRERVRDSIVAHIESAEGPCSRERFDAGAELAAEFIARILSPSLFAETRLFLLPHAQTLGDDDLDLLDEALSAEIPGVYCFIEIDGGAKSSAGLFERLHVTARKKTVPPSCLVLNFVRPRDYQIPSWLIENVPRLIHRRISKQDAEYLADRVGYDLDMLHSELQKIDLSLPADRPIDRMTIDRIAGAQREMTPFELAAAAGRQDFPQVVRIIDSLFSINVPFPLIASALARHFFALFRVKHYCRLHPEVGRAAIASRGSYDPKQNAAAFEIGKAAGLLRDGQEKKAFPFIIKAGIVEQAQRFTDEELTVILGWLLDFDIGFKTGRIDQSRNSLSELCYRIVRVKSVAEATP